MDQYGNVNVTVLNVTGSGNGTSPTKNTGNGIFSSAGSSDHDAVVTRIRFSPQLAWKRLTAQALLPRVLAALLAVLSEESRRGREELQRAALPLAA